MIAQSFEIRAEALDKRGLAYRLLTKRGRRASKVVFKPYDSMILAAIGRKAHTTWQRSDSDGSAFPQRWERCRKNQKAS